MKKLSIDKLVSTIHTLRKEKGLTQAQLADATGINRAMIGRIENKDYIPTVEQMQAMAEVLGFEVVDMAYFGFTNKLMKGEKIQIFNYGNCKRDFTYVDDIVEGVKRVMQGAPEKKNGEDGLPIPPYAVYNIGNNNPENLMDFVQILQEELIRSKVLPEDYDFEAHKELVPMQPGDVPVTYADTSALERNFGFKPSTSLRDGLRKFAEWYKEFYRAG